MFVSFFVTRIILYALGVEDLGLVNAIGGVASMFSFVSITLSTACSRYFSFELGKGEHGRIGEVFSMMMILYVVGALVLLLLMELVGGWYVLHKLVVPSGRANAAYLFFQLTIATWLVSWFSVPYSAVIVSYENMSLFSVLSIIDVLLKLCASLIVLFVKTVDSLMLYGVLLLIGAFAHTMMHVIIVRILYPICKFNYYINKGEMLGMLTFNGWQAFGALAWTTSDCFVNLLLNSFFGPVVNAARLVAYQLMNAVGNFTQGFLTATRPQIVKYWAAREKEEFILLLKRSSKISYFLTFFFALPLFVEAEIVLRWWLREPPVHTVAFTRIVLVHCLINTFSFPLVYGAQAVGRLGAFTLIGSGILLFTWPISWIALRCDCPAEVVFVIAATVVLFAVIARAKIMASLAGFSFWGFCNDVFCRMILFSLLSAIPVFAIHYFMQSGVSRFLCVGIGSTIASIFSFYAIGLDASERAPVLMMAKTYLRKLGVR